MLLLLELITMLFDFVKNLLIDYMLGYDVQSFRTVYYRKSLLNTYTNNEIPITGFIPPHSCTCPKPGPGSPKSYVGIFEFDELG